jgi:hypothetical protein
MKLLSPIFLGAALVFGWFIPTQDSTQDPAPEAGTLILNKVFHLGNDETPEWPEAAAKPDGAASIEFHFPAQRNSKQRAMEITSRHVDEAWSVTLNGVEITELKRGADRNKHVYPVPAKTLVDGDNVMRISASRVSDDITFGPVRLLDRGFDEIFEITPLRIKVIDAATGEPLVARITVANAADELAPLYYGERYHTPVRTGFAYTDAYGEALLQLGAGAHTIYASHGPEWSYAAVDLQHVYQHEATLELGLRHEVDTSGWVSADTHIHTLTFSGHGDASLQERILTLAGEGLDVAISTDHNHQTDYAPAQQQAGLTKHYLSIVGNEVTTKIGHFNAFPLPANGAKPNSDLIDWQELANDIRAKGAQVVILNHPRWPDRKEGPFGVSGLDSRTGYFADGLRLPVDAIEIFNSTTPETPWEEIIADWFSLLNAGSMVRGVGSSDSHTVGDPVGQGRTWLRSSATTPAEIDVEELCQNFRDGVSSMAIGLFGYMEVNGQNSGSMVVPEDGQVTVKFHVAGASWARADLVKVYMNGLVVAQSAPLPTPAGQPLNTTVSFRIPTPQHDAWLVCSATGPKPEGIWWTTLMPGLAVVSNPVWIDSNGDGKYQSPADTARLALDQVTVHPTKGPRVHELAPLLTSCDAAVAIQVMVLAKSRWSANYPDKLKLIPALASRHKDWLLPLLDD